MYLARSFFSYVCYLFNVLMWLLMYVFMLYFVSYVVS